MSEYAQSAGKLSPMKKLASIEVVNEGSQGSESDVYTYDAKYDGLLIVMTDNAHGKRHGDPGYGYLYTITVLIETDSFYACATQPQDDYVVTAAMMTLPITAGQRATLSYDYEGVLIAPFNILVYHSTFL